MKQPRHDSIGKPPAEFLETLYRRHYQAALVRSGASVIMWVFALAAYLAGIIRTNHFTGISVSVLYLILINPPALLLLKRIDRIHLYRYASLLINFLEILGYTAIIYFLGGIEATFLTPIYAALVTYVGVVAPRSFPYVIALLCSSALSFVVAGEYFGLLPPQRVVPSFDPPALTQLAYLSVVVGSLLVVAYISSRTAGVLKHNRNKLREKNLDLLGTTGTLQAELTERRRIEEALRESKEEAQRLAEESVIMAEIGRIVSSTLVISEVYELFAREVHRLIPFDRIGITIVDIDTWTGVLTYVAGKGVPDREVGVPYSLKGTAIAEMIRTKSTVLVQTDDLREVKDRFPNLLSTFEAGFRAIMNVPLVAKGQIIGALLLRSFDTDAYNIRHLQLAERVGRQIAGAIASARLYAERRRAEEALRESEERFRVLFDNAPIGYHELDGEGHISRVNRTELEMLGYTPEEMIGQPVWKFIMEKESEETVKAKVRGDKEPAKAFERTYRRKDGTTVPVLIDELAIKDREGHITGIRTTIQDITERKRAEEEKEKLQAQFNQAQKMESVGRLAGGVAHDFNNMLAVVIGNTELALLQADPGTQIAKRLQEALKASQRSADLVRQLLAFARKQTVRPRVVDLNDIIAEILKMLGRLIGENIKLNWIPRRDLWSVKVDPSQIHQVLTNLVVNSRDAITGSGTITLETENALLDEAYCLEHPEAVPGEYTLLSVSDSGAGMTREVMRQIFEPFFTTKEMGRGTGLGLSMVYGIVRQNNGFIDIDSQEGKGTRFKIYLPRPETSGDTDQKEESKVLPGGAETVLMVEDEQAVLEAGKVILKSLGYRVLTARTPQEAIRLAGAHSGAIDLLLTDVVMPGMNCREMAEQLKLIHPGLKCIFMSGYTADIIVRNGVLDEGVNFLHKPFSMKELAGKVREAIDGG